MKNNLIPQILLLVLIVTSLSFTPQTKEIINLTAFVTDCDKVDELHVLEFDGVAFKPVHTVQKEVTTEKEAEQDAEQAVKFKFKLPKTTPRFYYLGTDAGNRIPIILGSESNVMVQAECQTFKNAKVSNSQLNQDYIQVRSKLMALKNRRSNLDRQYQRSFGRADKMKEVAASLKALDEQMLEFYENLKKENPYLSKVIELNLYLSYANNKGKFNNEVEYFANQFFKYAKWSDVDYNYMPWVYESVKSYVSAIMTTNLPDEKQQEMFDNILKQIPAQSRTKKLAYGGIMAALKAKMHSNYGVYVQKFMEEYKDSDPEAVAALAVEMEKAKQYMIGGTPPDFTQLSPEGQPVSLSDFRGKVVLVDFWASWCGPCRRENPNVVRMYNKYKEKGFEILGVSLDRKKDAWVAAIEKDGLTWAQISDLRGWKNEVAQSYAVTSIPQTVLLDKEGRIVARNLRGPTLEAKLKEMFGE